MFGVCDRARVCVFDFDCSLFALYLLSFFSLLLLFVFAFVCFFSSFVYVAFCLLLFCFFIFCFFICLVFVYLRFVYFMFIWGSFSRSQTMCVCIYACVYVVCVVCARIYISGEQRRCAVASCSLASRCVCDRVLLLFLCLILFAVCLIVCLGFFCAVVCF